jgi:hypothetical protein
MTDRRCGDCEGCRWGSRCESWNDPNALTGNGGLWRRIASGQYVKVDEPKPAAVAPAQLVARERDTIPEPDAEPDLSDRDVARLVAALLRRLARRA